MTGSSAKTAPYPADTLSKGWRFELNMETVKKSDTWLLARNGLTRARLLLLWAESWEQTPCGSLPNDDELLSLLMDMDLDEFIAAKPRLMRGWWVADNGRLYHDTITERVIAMIDKRMSDAQRAANHRARKAGLSGADPQLTDTSRVTHGGLSSEFNTKHQNQNQNLEPEKKNPPKPPRKRRGAASQADLISAERLVEEGVDPQHAADWLVVRQKKDAPLTQTAWDGVKAEAVKAGITVADAVRVSAENNWQGFKASWMDKQGGGARASPGANKQEAQEQRNNDAAEDWAAKKQRELESKNATE